MLEHNLQSVEHLRISSKELPRNPVNDFPNVTQLTIEIAPNEDDDSFLTSLVRLIPLKQVTHLTNECQWLSIQNILRLIGSTPNLHTFKLYFSYINENDLKLLEQSAVFRGIALKSRTRYVYSLNRCTINEIQFLMKLFPRMESFHVPIRRREITEIILHIFQTNFRSLHRLLSLCLADVPKACLQEVDRLIKSRNLLQNYSLKYLNRDLYIWW